MSIAYNKNILTNDSKTIAIFDDEIKQVCEFQKIIIVCFKRNMDKVNYNNVVGLNYLGEEVWVVEQDDEDKMSSFVGVNKLDDKRAKLLKWDGTFQIIDVNTGTNQLKDTKNRPW